MIDAFGFDTFEPASARAALDVVVKATALLLLAFVGHGLLGRRRAAARSALWNACLVGLLLLPAADLCFPRVEVAVPAIESAGPDATTPPATTAEAPTAAPGSPLVDPFPAFVPGPIHDLGAEAAASPPRIAADPPSPSVSLWGLAAGAYLAVAALLALRLLAAIAGIARLGRDGETLDDPRWTAPLDRWRERLSIRRPVALRATSRVTVPVVIGCLRPTILVPAGLAGRAGAVVIDAALLHELAHVARGDYGWNLVRRLVQVVYWPHPLIWLVGRVVGTAREQACDDLCVHALGGPSAYREALLEVASGLLRWPGPALGMAMARGTRLGRRLACIERTRGASRCLARRPTRLALLVLVPVVAGTLGAVELTRAKAKAQEPAKPADAADARNEPNAIEVTVRSKENGEPLEGARVRATVDLVTTTLKADREGKARVDLSGHSPRGYVTLDVWADGHVQQRHSFAEDGSQYPKPPARLAIDLLPGEETLGGTVHDEQGLPIAGVSVAIWGYLGEKKQPEELAYMVDTVTDDQGRWRCRCFRSMKFAYLYLSHPDYLADDDSHPRRHGRPTPESSPQPDEKPLDSLRDFSSVEVLTRGVAIAGVVRDEAGAPIPGAEVGWLEVDQRQRFHDDLPLTTTDAEGRFRFPHARPGRLVLQVKAKGHAPELRSVLAAPDAEPVTITVGPPGTLTGRVVDTAGRPLADVLVGVDGWRGYRSLGVRFQTDADGRFRWDEAPQDDVFLTASRRGYQTDRSQQPRRPGEEATFILNREVAVLGRIRDARTGEPIDRGSVELGTPGPKAGEFAWDRDFRRGFVTQGFIQAHVQVEKVAEFRLRFVAPGYEPLESRTFRAGEEVVKYDISLTPAEKPAGVEVAGTVRRPDGTPLEGAEVAIAYPWASGRDRLPTVHIDGGALRIVPGLARTKTDARGRFTLLREPDPSGQFFAVVVVHPDGFAEVPRAAFEADPTIVARPWGRIEGVALFGSEPAAGATIRYSSDRLMPPNGPVVLTAGQLKADERGRFAIERVGPGEFRVSHGYSPIGGGTSPNVGRWSSSTLIEVKSGETTRVQSGGTGRPVVARIERPPGFDPDGEYVVHSSFSLESDRPYIPYPPEFRTRRDGGDAMNDWVRGWWDSAEGRASRRAYFATRRTRLEPDGSIRIEDVPPGDYRLSLSYKGDPVRGPAPADRVATATRQFTVPPIPGGRSDEPLDIGILRPKPGRPPATGQPAPPFDVEALDGGRIRLDDFRGKFVVVHFWSTALAAARNDLPGQKALRDRFADDDRVVVIGINLDADRDAARKAVAEQGLDWRQGFAVGGIEGPVAGSYRVEALPTSFLIDPEGTIKMQVEAAVNLEPALTAALRPR